MEKQHVAENSLRNGQKKVAVVSEKLPLNVLAQLFGLQ